MASAERRITVIASVYPTLQQFAERDGLTVADVVNAILLQCLRPYGSSCCQGHQPAPQAAASQIVGTVRTTTSDVAHPDPYMVAAVDTW